MKVICIDAKNIKKCRGCGYVTTILSEGCTYNASQDKTSNASYDIHEELNCITCGDLQSFSKHRFILLSEIDEMELVNEKTEYA